MSQPTTPFITAYNRLNSGQKLAVDTIDGPVIVIAGPGTGKTQVLSVRIANILQKTDTDADAILALTFTEAAAKNMRQRLSSIIGPAAYKVNINTFHGFCADIISRNYDSFQLPDETEPLSDLEKIQVIREILNNHQFEKLKPTNDPYYFCASILSKISELKREAVLPDDFAGLIKHEEQTFEKAKDELSKTQRLDQEKDLMKNRDLLICYRDYEKVIRERRRFDYDDMINLVIEKMNSDENLRLRYQERFQYFLVDEYQDTNSAQNELLFLLANFWGQEANLFVVGDPHQSIYRFQGASQENLLDFRKRYPQSTIITLTDNYRSTQTILDASYSLISHNATLDSALLPKIEYQLKSQSKEPGNKISFTRLPSETVEEFYVMKEIRRLLSAGTKPEEIAVLYRKNADSLNLSTLFAKEGIPYNLEGGQNILKDPLINQLISLLSLIDKAKYQQEDWDFFEVLHYDFFKLDSLDLLKLARYASEKQRHIVDVIMDSDFMTAGIVKNPEILIELIKTISQWQAKEANLTFVQFFEMVIRESGFLNWILDQNDKVERLNRLNTFYAEIKRMNRGNHNLHLSEFLTNLELMTENNLRIEEEDLDLQEGAITLSTAHRAKGLEWEHVFIIKGYDGKWGNTRVPEMIKLPKGILKNTDVSAIEKNEDERRLFYVALTRAKKKAVITFSESINPNSKKQAKLPTQFMTEIEPQFVELPDHLGFESSDILEETFAPHKNGLPVTIEEAEFLKGLLQNFRLSPTALDTYLDCPYKFKLDVLIRVPRAKDPAMSFGTAVHRALENFYVILKADKKMPTKEWFLQEFTKALQNEILTEQEFESQQQKGLKVLGEYYEERLRHSTPALVTERKFGGTLAPIRLGDIELSGKVDRIDLINKDEKTVKVVDYKTGKPQSRNQIEGKTQNSRGNYKRQLVFYKLLSDLDPSFNMKVVETEIDFVEKDSKNTYHCEAFEITQEEVEELKNLIRETMTKIRNLEFPHTHETKSCDYCDFYDHCYPNEKPRSN